MSQGEQTEGKSDAFLYMEASYTVGKEWYAYKLNKGTSQIVTQRLTKYMQESTSNEYTTQLSCEYHLPINNVKIKYWSNQNVYLYLEDGENNTSRLVLP